jgi:putative phosphoribosyl transferase
MRFANRKDAGLQLADKLQRFAGRADVIVLGLPRGGVPVAFEIATKLNAPLDVCLSRKLGVPGHEELAFGAVTADGGSYLDEEIIRAARISPQQIEQVIGQVKDVLNRRATLYRGDRRPLDVTGKTVILVDDGIATGASVYAAINALRQMKPAMLVLAVPVMPASTYAWLQQSVDSVVCLYVPDEFRAVGEFYGDFSQVEDQEVIRLLRRAEGKSPGISPIEQPVKTAVQEVFINLGNIRLAGTLAVPVKAHGLVLFAHGSGSSRQSPRNRFVAEVMQSYGMATLLFDLLTAEEEAVDQHTLKYRFDIAFLAARLVGATRWVKTEARVRGLPVAYFGASTGAAAALVAAAMLPDLIFSVVSRGGRPDLAGQYLARVRSSVLLLVGGQDEIVLRLNEQALGELQCANKQLVIVPGATHLFKEPGALEKVAYAAADWFDRTLELHDSSRRALAGHTATGF